MVGEPAAPAEPPRSLPEPACVTGSTNDCRPPREPKRRHPVRSRQLALWVLVKPLREVRETPFLPVPSSVPFQFCDPSWRLLLSFSPLGALKFHQVDAGEQAPGRLLASRQSRQLFWPAHPALLGWRAHLLPWFARCRWRRRGGRGLLDKTGEATAALLAEATGRGERTNFALSVSLVVVAAWFPGSKLKSLFSGVMFISLPFSFPPLELCKRR